MGSPARSSASPSLGRLLEISVGVEQPAEALATFAALGLREIPVADFAPGPSAVVSDGRLSIGLHDAELDGPTPTFVRPGLREHIPALEDAGAEFLDVELADDRFHRATFRDPNDLWVRLIEARSFPPVQPDSAVVAVCGRFVELSVATHSLEESASFWTGLGFTVVAQGSLPHASLRLEGHGLVLGLHETGRFRSALTFHAPQLDARLEFLQAKGFEPRRSSPLAAARSATLVAPGGVPLFLLDEG